MLEKSFRLRLGASSLVLYDLLVTCSSVDYLCLSSLMVVDRNLNNKRRSWVFWLHLSLLL
jgi:hypothetical protein